MSIKILCGEEVWNAMVRERDARVAKSRKVSGCYESDALCRFQSERWSRGFREAELVESVYGWSVRSATGLDNFQILAGVRYGTLDGSREAAERWAWSWFADDPTRRVVFER